MASRIAPSPEDRRLRLREPFPPELVYDREGPGGKRLSYVSIETVLERLLDVAPEYSWEASAHVLDDGRAYVTGQLTIDGKTAFGVGSMKHADLDMALKSANSEALKNAAKNGWGVMLELWNKDYLAALEGRKKLGKMSLAALKNEVFKQAREAIGKDKPTAREIAGHFGVDADALTDADTLRTILGSRL